MDPVVAAPVRHPRRTPRLMTPPMSPDVAATLAEMRDAAERCRTIAQAIRDPENAYIRDELRTQIAEVTARPHAVAFVATAGETPEPSESTARAIGGRWRQRMTYRPRSTHAFMTFRELDEYAADLMAEGHDVQLVCVRPGAWSLEVRWSAARIAAYDAVLGTDEMACIDGDGLDEIARQEMSA